jgi:hypothetical protein
MKTQLNNHYTHKGTFNIAGLINVRTKLYYNPSERWNGFRCPAVAVDDLPTFVAEFNEAAQEQGFERLFVLRGSTLYFYDTDGEGYEFASALTERDGCTLLGYDVSCGLAWDLND